MTRIYALSAVAAVAALLGGVGYSVFIAPGGDDRFAGCRATNVAGGTGMIGGPFTLVNTEGKTVTDADVITEPSILYFGYTFCPDICPFDVARNADAADLLAEKGISVTPIFISIDPERDTPDVVDAFVHNISPRMIGLTGSLDQVRAASQAYRTYFRKAEDGDPDYYTVDHSTFTYLVLPGHGTVEVFNRDTTAEQMAETTACFAEAAS